MVSAYKQKLEHAHTLRRGKAEEARRPRDVLPMGENNKTLDTGGACGSPFLFWLPVLLSHTSVYGVSATSLRAEVVRGRFPQPRELRKRANTGQHVMLASWQKVVTSPDCLGFRGALQDGGISYTHYFFAASNAPGLSQVRGCLASFAYLHVK